MSHSGQIDQCKATLTEGKGAFWPTKLSSSKVVWPTVTQGLHDCRYAPFEVLQAASIALPNAGNFAHS
jgi:hypothetical protein